MSSESWILAVTLFRATIDEKVVLHFFENEAAARRAFAAVRGECARLCKVIEERIG